MLDLEEALSILGLNRDCTAAQVRWRFLILAKQLHPDKSHANTNTHSRFLKVREAYDYLIANIKDRGNCSLDSTHSKFNGYIETLEHSELEYNLENKSYKYLCRCGSTTEFHIIRPPDNKFHNFTCQGCSLGYRISFSSNAN